MIGKLIQKLALSLMGNPMKNHEVKPMEVLIHSSTPGAYLSLRGYHRFQWVLSTICLMGFVCWFLHLPDQNPPSCEIGPPTLIGVFKASLFLSVQI